MLVNKKTKKSRTKTKNNADLEEENIQSLRSWIRKIEQSTTSIGSRLAAVEKRLSSKKLDTTNSSLSPDILQGPIERIFQTIKEEKKKQTNQELVSLLDIEFTVMQDELVQQHQDIDTMKQQLNDITTALGEIDVRLQRLNQTTSNLTADLTPRMKKIEQREPPVIRLGDMEVPIEITGIIGGILAFIVAFLVIIEQKDIIISPLFLSFIGIILIGSALIKSVDFHRSSRTHPKNRQILQSQPIEATRGKLTDEQRL